jgi:predicted amidohydrolase YtcJ
MDLPADLFLDDVVLVEGAGARGPTDVLLRGGRIAATGDLVPEPGVTVVTGGYVTPGLIDSHVHISMAPGAAWRPEDAPEALAARRAAHLRSYLACGVTSLLDPALLPEDARSIRALEAAGPSPNVFLLGPAISPTDGYVAVVIPTFPSASVPADLPPLFDTFTGLDPVGVKITMETGSLYPIWPVHTPEMRAALVAESDRRGLPRYVHAMSEDMYEAGLDLKPHTFVHAPQSPLSDELLARVAASGAYVSPTMAIAGTSLYAWHPEVLEDPWLIARVPADELATARDPANQDRFMHAMLDTLAPIVPKFLQGLLIKVAGSEGAVQSRLDDTQAAVRQLHEAGVPLVVGSDSGNWPIILYMFHGPSTHLELELMVSAGLTPLEALAAATATPAKMLGREGEIGSLQVGAVADLLVLDADPSQSVGALKQPRLVVRAGHARTPEQWLATP